MNVPDFLSGSSARFAALVLGVAATVAVTIVAAAYGFPFAPLFAIPILLYALYAVVWVRVVSRQINETSAWLSSTLGAPSLNHSGVIGASWRAEQGDRVLSIVLLRFADGATIDVGIADTVRGARLRGIVSPWNRTEVKFGLRRKPIARLEEIITGFYEHST